MSLGARHVVLRSLVALRTPRRLACAANRYFCAEQKIRGFFAYAGRRGWGVDGRLAFGVLGWPRFCVLHREVSFDVFAVHLGLVALGDDFAS
jgi:hypothetical protein